MKSYPSFSELTDIQREEFIASVAENTSLYYEWLNNVVYYGNSEFYELLKEIFDEFLTQCERKFNVQLSFGYIDFSNTGNITFLRPIDECIFIESGMIDEYKLLDYIQRAIPDIRKEYNAQLFDYYSRYEYIEEMVSDDWEFASPVLENGKIVGAYSEWSGKEYTF